MERFEFQHAAVAGTFDRLHKGHKALLTKAFQAAKLVSVGITSPHMVEQKTMHDKILSYAKRVEDVKDFLKENDWLGRAQLFALDDMYGRALTDSTIEALVVSTKTIDGGKIVNDKRETAGLPPLVLVVADYIESDDHSYLSSTRIRLGEIDRNGHAFIQFLLEHAPFALPYQLRSQLQKPLGEVLHGSEKDLSEAVTLAKRHISKDHVSVCVGDVVSYGFLEEHIVPNCVIIDHINKRKPAVQNIEVPNVFEITHIKNAPATIGKEAIEMLLQMKESIINSPIPQQIIVKGEEDLLVLPLILLLPISSTIFYGQADQGIVMVEVTETKKDEIYQFLQLWI